MKAKTFQYAILGAAALLAAACADHNLPADPVLTSPISGLVLNVSGEDYTAVPVLGDAGAYTGTYELAVKIPGRKATVVQIDLADKSLTSNIAVGDEIEFEDNKYTVTLYRGASEAGRYTVEMSFNPPPFYYFIKTSDKDADGNRYFLDLDHPQTIASGTYDEWYEGYVDLTMSNWDNVGLVSSELTTIYDYCGGPWPPLSHYMWTGSPKAAPGTGYYPVDGPWNDWKATDGNPDIVSPGVWRVYFNNATGEVDMTMTQWCLSGSAAGATAPMTYDSATRTWTADATLSAGKLRFVTVPVSFGDPTFDLGLSSGISELAEGGEDIQISEAGNYSVTLDLSNAPYYTYTLQKN